VNIEIREQRGSATSTFCPSCNSEVRDVRYRVLHDIGDRFIYQCRSCRLMYLHPLLLTELDNRQMESVNDAELFSPVLQRLHKLLIVDREIKAVQWLLGRQDFSLLDVGCGTGWITALWRDQGATVTGLEPSQNRRRIACDQRGLRAREIKPK
jgi:2-polyprenyl-3-methyl-5-hydroxy-6-metoxy-1,4-benzoquinol methylase